MLQYLSCPRCGSDNLHQIHVEVGFRRQEDEPESLIVNIDKAGVETCIGGIEDRRDALKIAFACESCDTSEGWTDIADKPQLRIWQHKGTTYMEWVGMNKPVKLTNQ